MYLGRAFFVFILVSLVIVPSYGVTQTSTISLKVFPLEYTLNLEGKLILGQKEKTVYWKQYKLPSLSTVVLRAPGYKDTDLQLEAHKNKYEVKLERIDSNLELRTKLPSGKQPKSLITIQDGKILLAAQLDGPGLDIYNTENFEHLGLVKFPPNIANKHGFVEFAYLPWQNEVWVSQMTTNQVHVLNATTLEYTTSMATGGDWPKVICLHPIKNLAFVSNWVGESVAVFDTVSKKRLALWKTTGTPRGMVVSPDGRFLYVASFGTGYLDKFQISSGKKVKTINTGKGAKRHLLSIPERAILIASDMELGQIWVYDMITDKLLRTFTVGPKVNTCDLSPDNRFLFVSNRGTNNPISYLIKGPDYGKLSVFDTKTWSLVDWAWGMNQPTGLTVNPNKKEVYFSNFLDDTIEVYDFSGLYQ